MTGTHETRHSLGIHSFKLLVLSACSGGVTPDPIPNSAVKPSSADGSHRILRWSE